MNQTDLKKLLRLKLEELVDGFVVNGAKQAEIFDAIEQEVGRLRAKLALDPDPADDDSVLDEPANDWPSAER